MLRQAMELQLKVPLESCIYITICVLLTTRGGIKRRTCDRLETRGRARVGCTDEVGGVLWPAVMFHVTVCLRRYAFIGDLLG